MGLAKPILSTFFGGGRNAVAETVGIFQENKEAAAERQADHSAAVLAQFAAEFTQPRRGLFDRFMDAVNRIPRPAMALGTLGLFAAAMTDPVWFAARMQGIALVPEPLWWLMGAIVSFYFGARYQAKAQDFQRSLAASVGRARKVTENIAQLGRLDDADDDQPADGTQENQALQDWRRSNA